MDVLCRICLGEPSPWSIFTSQICHNGSVITCRDMMSAVFSFVVSPDDGLPSTLCQKCYSRLAAAYRFKRLAERTYVRLLEQTIKRERHDFKTEEINDDDFQALDVAPDDMLQLDDCCVKLEKLHDSHDTLQYDSDDDKPLIHSKMINNVDIKSETEEHVALLRDKKKSRKGNGSTKKNKTSKTTQHKNKPEICHLCGKLVKSLKHHSQLHDENRKRQTCKYCPRTFATYGAVKNHTAVHHFGSLYYCELCKRYYTRKNEHIRTAHSDRAHSHACTWCDKKFRTEAGLKFHITLHTKEKPFPCSVCNKGFRSKGMAEVHKRRVHDLEKSHICQYCSKSFFSLNHLDIHVRIHTKERNYKCKECNKSFITFHSLKIHEKRHTGVRPEKCTFCDRTFFNKSALAVHTISHTKEKRYDCKYCGRKFGRSDHRNRHQRTAHETQGSVLNESNTDA